MHVLVVDDYEDAVDSEVMLLRLWKHKVSVARDGVEALETANRENPDAVLLDLDLPKLDGWEVARRLRNHDQVRCTLLLAISGCGQAKDVRRSLESGFDFHLIKPVAPPLLQHLLEVFEDVDNDPAACRARVAADGCIERKYIRDSANGTLVDR